MGILAGCKPRKEVLKGDLGDAVFAADFGDLVGGKAPAVYGDPKTFFQNTHPADQLCKIADQLCKIVGAVFGRLARLAPSRLQIAGPDLAPVDRVPPRPEVIRPAVLVL